MSDLKQRDVESSEWLDLDWSDWSILDSDNKKMSQTPETPGFFRIKQTTQEGLQEVGSTGRSLNERLKQIARKVDGDDSPKNQGTAAAHLWDLKEFGGRFKFSYANPNIARSETDRLGIENMMFASHIRSTGRSPTVNLNRRLHTAADSAVENLEWGRSSDFLAPYWMGLDWSEPRKLEKRMDIDCSKAVYRIWFPSYAPPLAYIGKSRNVANRLIKHEKKFGGQAMFSVAPVENNLKDIEAALIGTHYRFTNTLPKGQDGRRNKFKWGL